MNYNVTTEKIKGIKKIQMYYNDIAFNLSNKVPKT